MRPMDFRCFLIKFAAPLMGTAYMAAIGSNGEIVNKNRVSALIVKVIYLLCAAIVIGKIKSRQNAQ